MAWVVTPAAPYAMPAPVVITAGWLLPSTHPISEPYCYQLLQTFSADPTPTWVWGQDDWQLTRQLITPYGLLHRGVDPHNAAAQSQLTNRVLIQYRYTGSHLGILRLRPLISDRSFHNLQKQEPDLAFSQLIGNHQVFLQALQGNRTGTPWQLRWSQGNYQPEGVWYWSYLYPEEAKRGLEHLEDLYSPGYLTVLMQPGETLAIEARVGMPAVAQANLSPMAFEQAVLAKQQRLEREFLHLPQVTGKRAEIWERLLRASDQFIAYQSASMSPTFVAGYHWFGDRSRDLLLSLPGFALTTKRFALARRLLDRLGKFCHQGLIPNELPEPGRDVNVRSIDCSLWWIETLGLYLEASQDWDFLEEQYAVVKQIYKAFTAGTAYGVHVDISDGLLTWDDITVPLTWMDTVVDQQAVTLRHGKPIEINALWYSALCWASQWAERLHNDSTLAGNDRLTNQARRYAQQAEEVKASLQKYWNAQAGYLYDRIEPDDRKDASIRPNAVIALSLHHCAFSPDQGKQVLQVACDRLLTPYGLRTLEPTNPAYRGRCRGTPRQRDLSYHQGTVWSYLLGPFIRAWKRAYGSDGKPLPLDLNPLLNHFSEEICFWAISEIFDGNSPHKARGAIAHSSPVAELLRHWHELDLDAL
jgi:predicted glycogen debranching enzyme